MATTRNDADSIPATITERGNGWPEVGDYVPGDDGYLYRVASLEGQIQTGQSGCGNWIRATVKMAEWGDVDSDDDVFPASAIVAHRRTHD